MSTAVIVLLAIYLAGVIFNFVKLMLWNKADNVDYTGFADYVTAAIFSLSSWLFWIFSRQTLPWKTCHYIS